MCLCTFLTVFFFATSVTYKVNKSVCLHPKQHPCVFHVAICTFFCFDSMVMALKVQKQTQRQIRLKSYIHPNLCVKLLLDFAQFSLMNGSDTVA